MTTNANGNGSSLAVRPDQASLVEAIGGKMSVDRTHELSAVAVAAAAKAQVEARFLVALSRPRSFDRARERVLASCSRPGFAEKAIYRKPQGKTTITGLSIRFAEEALRAWGNIDVSADVVYDDEERVEVRITATDLETNFTDADSAVISKRVERKGSREGGAPAGREVIGTRLNSYGEQTYVVRATDDEVMTKVAAAKSKLIRNCGLRLIPADLLEEARNACESTSERETAQNLPEARKKMIGAFGKLTPPVTVDALSKFLGHDVNQANVSEMTELRQVFTSVSQEGSRWAEILASRLEARAPTAPTAPEAAPAAPVAESKAQAEASPTTASTPPAKDAAAPEAQVAAAAPLESSWPPENTDPFADRLINEMREAKTAKALAQLSTRKNQCPQARQAQVLAIFREKNAELTK